MVRRKKADSHKRKRLPVSEYTDVVKKEQEDKKDAAIESKKKKGKLIQQQSSQQWSAIKSMTYITIALPEKGLNLTHLREKIKSHEKETEHVINIIIK